MLDSFFFRPNKKPHRVLARKQKKGKLFSFSLLRPDDGIHGYETVEICGTKRPPFVTDIESRW